MNAICKSDFNHRARCECAPNFKGDPYTRCVQPECVKNDDCPYFLSCKNEKCVDPCACAPGAHCKVQNHQPICNCPSGYTGNGYDSCQQSNILKIVLL